MKRLLIVLLILMPGIVAAQTVTNPLTKANLGKYARTDCRDPRVFCVGKETGAEYSTICGMTPGTGGANSCGDATDLCTSTSALGVLRAAEVTDPNFCSPATPCLITVGPGRYNECVHFDNVTDISFIGAGQDATIIRPTVTTENSVANGTVRFGVLTTARNSTARIEVSGFTIQNDAWGSPESAVQINKKAGPSASSASQDIYIHDNTIIGNHDGAQVYGSKNTTDEDPPRVTFARNRIVGGDALAFKGIGVFLAVDNDLLSQPNYCSTAPAAKQIAFGPTAVQAGAGSTSTFRLDAADIAVFTSDQDLVGRKVTFGGGGACGADTNERWVYNSIASTGIVSFYPVASATLDDADCTYEIAAVTHSSGVAYAATGNWSLNDSPCTDVNWRAMRNETFSGTFWKNTCIHISSNVVAGGEDSITLTDNRCTINMNDFGPDPNGVSACNGQSHVAPLLAYGSSHKTLTVNGFTATSNINVDMPDSNACVNPLAGISFTGDVKYTGPVSITHANITINNRGDPDEEVVCLNAKSTGTAFTVNADGIYCDINNTVGSYVGASYTAYQANNTLLNIGSLTSPDVITTSGTIGLLSGATGFYSATIDPNSITAPLCQNLPTTITAPTAAVGDSVTPAPDPNQMVAGVQYGCWVSAADTVTCQQCCIVGTCDAPSATFGVSVRKK